MKKILLTLLMSLLIITGCGNNTKEPSLSELKQLQQKIEEKLDNITYNNLASYGIDEENKKVIIELVNNTKEEQDWFKENITDSPYIEFKQGGPYKTLE